MQEITFIHAADVHLGRPFSGLERSSPELANLFRRAEIEAWNRLVATAVQRGVTLVTLAGDVFDSCSPTVRARVAFQDGVRRLYQSGIPVFMALGNHDPLATFPDSLHRLEGLHVFGPEPEGVPLQSAEVTEGLMVFGASFLRSSVRENLAQRFRRDSGIEVAVAVLHANVSGSVGHADYSPCTVNDLKAAGMDVWCLGHVHAPSVLCDDPLIMYPGASQGAHINERGPRGCYLVTVNRSGRAAAEFIPLGPVVWASVDLDVTEMESVEDLVSAAEAACCYLPGADQTVEAGIVRINLTGVGRMETSAAITKDKDLLDVVAGRLLGLSVPVFVESVRDVTSPWLDLDALTKEEGFLGDFVRICRETASDDREVNRILQDVQQELLGHVGHSYLPEEFRFPGKYEVSHSWNELFEQSGLLVAKMFLELEDA
jgi:DNA repair exonuclease SbcCD nuclease subunit